MKPGVAVALASLLLAAPASRSAEPETASFQGVGFLAGPPWSQALGVSSNGAWVAGVSRIIDGVHPVSDKDEAFRWSEDGLEALGRFRFIEVTLPGTSVGLAQSSLARAISNDGSTSVGDACMTIDDPDCTFLCPCVPAIFTGANIVPLNLGGYAGGPNLYSGGRGFDVRADGTQALFTENLLQQTLDPVGAMFLGDGTSTSWGAGGGLFDQFDDGAVSPDGGWVAADYAGMFGGSFLVQVGVSSIALDLVSVRDVTRLGLFVAGGKDGEAALWTEGVTTTLGDLPGGATQSDALGVADGGGVVVGWGTTGAGEEAFLWTPDEGMRRLADVLADEGLDLTGWTLVRATGVSASGRTIVGWGSNPNGDTEGFVARLAPEPLAAPALGPLAAALLGVALLAVGFRRASRV